MKIKISEKLFREKENSPLLKPQEKNFQGSGLIRAGPNIDQSGDVAPLNLNVKTFL